MSATTVGWLARVALTALVWFTATAADAQILENVDVTQDGENAIVRIRFAVLIQYLRHVPVDSGDAIRVFFQITARDDTSAGIIEEERRPQPNTLIPRMRVLYPNQAPGVQRRIDILFDRPVNFSLRPLDNHTLELLIPLSAEQRAKLKAAAPAPVPDTARLPATPTPSGAATAAPAQGAATPQGAAPAPSVTPAPSTPPTPGAAPAPGAAPPSAAGSPPSPAATTGAAPKPGVPPAPVPAAAATSATAALPLPPAPIAPVAPSDVDRRAAADYADGRAALEAADFERSTRALNRLLNLPPNAYTQAAQELIGVARERSGDLAKARVEFENYLGQYPDGPGAARVRQRLAALPPAAPPAPGAAAAKFAAGALPLPPIPAAPPVPSDLDRRAAADYAEGRKALEDGDFERATLALNRLLNLPPNAYTQAGQELIGIAREKNGELAKAKAEFELYLKLYPEGPGAARVAERMAALAPAAAAVGPAAGAPAPAGGAPAFTYWGSLSQYYYGGQSQATTTTTTITPATGATTIDTAKLSATDQSQLITNVDITGRYRTGDWDSRVVVRDSYNWNFLNGNNSQNTLTAAYAETRYLPSQLGARVGRQSGTSGGILGLFDGAIGSWGFAPNYRVNAVVGQPVNPPFGTTKTFYGASVDADNIGTRFSGNAFVIRQTVSGYEDRLGIGGELRYFDAERNVYSLVDYDPTFRALNIGMVQGTWQFPTQTTLNFIADYRRTPTLQLTNALITNPTSSINSLVQTLGLSGTRDLAKSVTPISKVYLLGLTQQLSPMWQLGFDFRISSLNGTPAVQSLPATAGTGNVYTYTLQAIGNSITRFQDILVLNTSALRSNLFNAWLFGVDYRFVVMQTLTLEPLLKYYRQSDNAGLDLTRTTPGFRASWRIRDRFSLEAEFDLERTHSSGPLVNDDVTRRFFYVGWRWDL